MQSTVAAISGLHCRGAGYGQFEHMLTALSKFKEAAERSERLMYEQSHRDYLRSAAIASSSACHEWLIITVYTPLPTKPSATKNARELAGERGNYRHADASA